MDTFHPVRKKKIQRIKNKILRKLYNTKELKDKMVNKLARPEDLQNMVYGFSSGKRLNPDSSTTGKKTEKTNLYVREEKIKEAKEKSRRGYYNNPEVFSKIAQRLVDLFGR